MSKIKVGIGPIFCDFVGTPVHILSIQRHSRHDICDIPSHRMRKMLAMSPKREKLYRRFMDQSHLINLHEVLHSHGDVWFTELCNRARTPRRRWVHTYHTMYFEEDYPNGCQDWQRDVNNALTKVASKADIKICISEWFHQLLKENYSIDTRIIPNGYDSLACENADAKRFIDKHNIKDFVLFVGRYDAIKRPETFIQMAEKMPEVVFAMIGSELTKNEASRHYGKRLPANLRMLGPMPHGQAMDAMAACSAFVMTSKREGIPTVLLEAMGLGKPSIAPNHSGCREIIQGPENGFLYEPENIDDLVEKTHKALESKNVAENGKRHVQNKYSWPVIIKQIDKVYEELVLR